MKQEQIIQFQLLEQEANQLNQQLQLIEQNISEIQELKSSLNEIEKKETNEILVNIGKKIYIPVEIKDKKLIVEVGNKKFVKKAIPETKELIEEQINRLGSARMQIAEKLDMLQGEAETLMKMMEKEGEKE